MFNEEMLGKAKEVLKKMKVFGIIVAIIMILLGACIFFVPESAAVIILWMMVAGMLILGISEIIFFCSMPKGARNGWNLASGIIWVVLAVMLMLCDLNADVAEKLVLYGSIEMMLGFMVGFSILFNGISMLCAVREVRAIGGSGALCIVGGILSILAALTILSYPIGAFITVTIFYGLFLLVGGISLLCRVLSFK